MLKNYGFNVIDLGKNVPKEAIVEAAKEHNAKLVGLSALMTTTMQKMKEVVDYRNEIGADFKIMLGGAVVTEEYAKEIGADAYSSDAADAVKVAARLLNLSL
jgi:5-methyltetrahydrofolate--homocysteine methyltransferase